MCVHTYSYTFMYVLFKMNVSIDCSCRYVCVYLYIYTPFVQVLTLYVFMHIAMYLLDVYEYMNGLCVSIYQLSTTFTANTINISANTPQCTPPFCAIPITALRFSQPAKEPQPYLNPARPQPPPPSLLPPSTLI